MEDNADIIWVDARNAINHDHRTGNAQGRTGFGNRIPPGWANSPALRGPMPMNYQQPVVYAQAPQTFAASFLGKLTAGQVVDMVAQLFAMLAPLPAAPVVTKDAVTDTGNMIVFQSALASYAKRDEQVRTLGAIVGKLVG